MKELALTGTPSAFDSLYTAWHTQDAANPDDGGPFTEGDRPAGLALHPLAFELARRNYELWHEEDKARRTDVADSVIAGVKRNIDKLNQARNDLIERLDEAILVAVGAALNESAELVSETPGSIVDRLSIISLKVYHMAEDKARQDVDDAHRARSGERHAVLLRQRADLAGCLEKLLTDLAAGSKLVRPFRQYKMYNDPTLNPELYGKR